MPLLHQESYRMDSFAYADCIIQLEENRSVYQKGEVVEVNLIK
jgi:molybdopterin biosynthesis enzyme